MSEKAVCLDLDGTLFDTAPEICAAANRALVELGQSEVDYQEARGYIGDGLPRFAKRMLTKDRWAEPAAELAEKMMKLSQEFYAETFHVRNSLYPNVLETLKELAQAGWALAVVTNKPRRYTEPLLSRFLAEIDFAHLVAGDDGLARKPDSAGLLAAMEALQVTPGKTVMVGDSSADEQASKAARVGYFALASYGYHSEQLPRLECDCKLQRFEDLLPFCDGIQV